MNSKNLLVTSLFIAVMIVCAAIIYTRSGPQEGDESTKVTVEQAMTRCRAQDQCIMMDTKCNFCCDFVAINARYEAAYNALFDETCGMFSVKHCKSCNDSLTARPQCVNGTCQMVKWEEKRPTTPSARPTPTMTQAPARTPMSMPVTTPVPAPAPVVAPVTTPQTAPAPRDPFGENQAPLAPPAVAPAPAPSPVVPVDDLNAPFTEADRPKTDQVDVIRP